LKKNSKILPNSLLENNYIIVERAGYRLIVDFHRRICSLPYLINLLLIYSVNIDVITNY